ncbi:MAG: site-specific integrase [Campylobacterota bacterium]|nr:site-specific integrase [Campylobacterota bacterium]
MKLKIMNRLASMGLGDKGFTMTIGESSLNLVAENETEKKLLAEMEKTVTAKINRLSKDHNVAIEDSTTRDTMNLKTYTDKFLLFKEKTGTSKKVMMKYRQAVEYLIIFFGAKKNLKNITNKEANDFQLFLLDVPQRWKTKADLKGKDIKLLIDKNSKLLDKYEKQKLSTIMAVLKIIKATFNYFMDNTYIYSNPFNSLSKIQQKPTTDKREFQHSELKSIFQYLVRNKRREDYNFLKFLLYTGLRRGEALTVTCADIDLTKSLIDIDGTKTKNAKRIAIIHQYLNEVISYQTQGKNIDDYLFYNQNLTLKYRDEKVGNELNKVIKDVLGDELKKVLDLHSLRKSFAQEIYLADVFDDLAVRTLMGHSTKNDVTDTHYLRGKRDYKILKANMDKVDFSKYF